MSFKLEEIHMILFKVIGRPQQRGSKTPWLPRKKDGSLAMKNGRPVIATMDSNKKSKDWMQSVRDAAAEALPSNWTLLQGPVSVHVVFMFARPKKHYRKNGDLVDGAPIYHTNAPDCDKLLRCLFDGCTGVVWIDDKQVSVVQAEKLWTDGTECALVTITENATALTL